MTRKEFRKFNLENIDEVLKIYNEERCCWAFDNIHRLNDECLYILVMHRLKMYGIMSVKHLLENVQTDKNDAYVYVDKYGCLRDLDEDYFACCLDVMELELSRKGYFKTEH